MAMLVLAFATNAQARTTTAESPREAILYPSPGFEGRPVNLNRTGTWNKQTSGWDEMAACVNGSLKVAPGYRLRITYNGSNHVLYKTEDDPDLTDDTMKDLREITVEKAPEPVLRPMILLVLHGNAELADDHKEPEWDFVRKNLDGIWYNSAHVSQKNVYDIASKVSNQTIYNEQDSQVAGIDSWKPLEASPPNRLLDSYPRLRIKNEANCLFKGYNDGDAVLKWSAGEMDWAREAYCKTRAQRPAQAFAKVFTGWQPFPFMEHASSDDKRLLAGTEAEAAFNSGDGAFMECPPSLFMNNKEIRYAVENCARICHEQGKTLLLVHPASGEGFRRTRCNLRADGQEPLLRHGSRRPHPADGRLLRDELQHRHASPARHPRRYGDRAHQMAPRAVTPSLS